MDKGQLRVKGVHSFTNFYENRRRSFNSPFFPLLLVSPLAYDSSGINCHRSREKLVAKKKFTKRPQQNYFKLPVSFALMQIHNEAKKKKKKKKGVTSNVL
ncbi:hypothetical protein POVWA1_005190 [Plasmodium ovale wallikeri]|uniref:Uncharacterized protein n=1 Tax=Plasmodium ovale wallikeri TaxID=864142 RepID=A0A1A8YHN0_PLAOA|nr:hypothetical protein POVWA1_005190 [Plasmodium ovale wallikeri]